MLSTNIWIKSTLPLPSAYLYPLPFPDSDPHLLRLMIFPWVAKNPNSQYVQDSGDILHKLVMILMGERNLNISTVDGSAKKNH